MIHTTALIIFCIAFLLVTVAGFLAARWRRPVAGLNSLEEWGLAGRSFGTVITWFLMGGELYTAYTIIAVPAALYGGGAIAYFAVPYCIFIYPYMMIVLPRLWRICHRNGHITFADLVRGIYANRALTLAVAITGILSLMPYIALQLVGMKVVIAAMGVKGEWPLVAAFVILAAYTYSAGLRAPAVIAVVKDVMLYIMVFAGIIILPWKLGGFAHIFAVAKVTLAAHTPAASTILKPSQYLAYTTLALGSTIALVLYPHAATGMLAADSENTLRRNAALLPAYSFLLGLLVLLGYVAIAAGIVTTDKSSVIPLLYLKMFPEWFGGFCLAAIAIGALVPAAIMSIAASNLFTRNIWGELAKKPLNDKQQSQMAKIVSLLVKFGALAFVIESPTSYAIVMQLLAAMWISQLFPAVILSVFTRWFHSWALFCGWLAGMVCCSWMAWVTQLKTSGVYPLHLFGDTYSMYAAIPALILNLFVAVALTPIFRRLAPQPQTAENFS